LAEAPVARAIAAAVVLVLLALGAAKAADPPLTPDGWGALRIGMREAEAARLFKLEVPPDDEVNSIDCREIPLPAGGPDASVMTQEGKVTRISLYGPSPLKTDRGFGVGSREADIRKSYGAALKVEPHHYEGPKAHYLTVWNAARKRGVRYETNDKGVVTILHVGDESIRYVESCL